MKLVFSTINIDNTTAILHPRTRNFQKIDNSQIHNNTNIKREFQTTRDFPILQNSLSFDMFGRLTQTKNCNCGK